VAAEREWEPVRAHAVRRVVASSPGAVVALGAGHASYTDAGSGAVAAAALGVVSNRVLVLPSLDRQTALVDLRRRSLLDKGTDWVVEGHDFLAEWFDDRGMRALATSVVVTQGRTPGRVAEEIAALARPGRAA
jgi:hypothetical protein